METVTKLPPRPRTKEPDCLHYDPPQPPQQPASACRVCSVDGRLAEWRKAWRLYDEACVATGECDMRPMPDRPPFKAPAAEWCVVHNSPHLL